MSSALYLELPTTSPRRSHTLSEPLIAEIVLDVQARQLKDRLFSYRIPQEMAGQIFIGAQVLVPFGHQEMVGGYVVSIGSVRKGEFQLKDIAELVEPDPLFDKNYIDFLHWLAFRSCAQLQDVIQAALPSCIAPRIKRLARLSPRVQIDLVKQYRESPSQSIRAIVHELAGNFHDDESTTRSKRKVPGVSIPTLRRRVRISHKVTQPEFYRALNFLKLEGFLEIATEPTATAGPKIVRQVLIADGEPDTARQKEIVAVLKQHAGCMKLSELVKQASTSSNTIQKMVEAGSLRFSDDEVFRDPMRSFGFRDTDGVESLPELTDDQTKCLDVLSAKLELAWQTHDPEIQPEPWLLFGVTGSGKTEVYLRLIRQTLDAGKAAMLLVPEISLTPQLASRLKARFNDQISIWHSGISDGERYDTWRGLKNGTVRVLLGARSAILAHVPNLGLIILDEEHDGSYKQTSPSPRYNAKEVAMEKARRQGALVLFGSATPDLVSYHRAVQSGQIVELPNRVHKQPMPHVSIVDMRNELKSGNRSILSQSLAQSLKETLERGEQAILLMNRRGYASHVFCRACGFVAKCMHCSVSLVFHQFRTIHKEQKGGDLADRGYLACHHCGYEKRTIITCPSCSSPFIKEYGLGTQKVEEFVQSKYPQARLCRLDSDVTARKGAYRDVFERFKRGDADILIGTQIVAKGLDIANVTLVGVLVADAALNMPDYRATERGFQLLSQVAGRAGRGDKPGKVILQTYNADLDVLRLAKSHDFQAFFQSELAAREAFQYPPFSRLIRVVLTGPDAQEVEMECGKLAEEISSHIEEAVPLERLQILGPAPCLIERIKTRFRFHLLIKIVGEGETMDRILGFLRNRVVPKQLTMAVDVDALDLL